MNRRVFPVLLPHATDDACRDALRAGASVGALFVEVRGALPRLGEELTVTCRRAGGRELLRIDGRATWAVHDPIGRYRRGFAIALLEGATSPLEALLMSANPDPAMGSVGESIAPPFATARPGSTLPAPALDEGLLTTWRSRRAERERVVVDAVEVPAPSAPQVIVTASFDDVGNAPMPAITVDAFAVAARDEAHAAATETPAESASGHDDVVTSDGQSTPRRNPWLSNPEGEAQELPRLVDDDEEDATLLIGPRARPVPSLPEGEPIPFPTLSGAAWVIAADRPKRSASTAEKLSWPRSGTKRGMSGFADNDDTIPVGLWAMPSLAHHSITSDEETPDELSDPRLIVRAADRARALDSLSDVPDLPDVRPSGTPRTPLPPTLHRLVDDPDDESTDAALDESTADASAEDALDASVSSATIRASGSSSTTVVGGARAPLTDATAEATERATADDARNAPVVDASAPSPLVDDPVTKRAPAGTSDVTGAATTRVRDDERAHRSAILVAWGAETPRVLFDGDTALPMHTVLDVPRRHLRFAEIAVFEGAAASELPKALLGIVRLQVTPETNSRTLPVRFSLTDDGVIAVSYDGRVVERFTTAWAPRARTPVVEDAPSTFVGRLKRLFQGH